MREHSYISTLKQRLVEKSIDRREFLRTATLLGISAGAAYAFVGRISGDGVVKPVRAVAMPKGGTIRIAMRVHDVKNPHTLSWGEAGNIVRQVCGYMTQTGPDNITRPDLLESWEVSNDLKTWTLHVRRGIKWHNGRALTAEDIAWNINHVPDANTGSSCIGLMKSYMLKEVGKGDAKTTGLWDPKAIEIIDSHTVRLNTKQAQLAVPEHLFHYPLLILDPEEGGKFGVGSNGTGAFNMIKHKVGQIAIFEARDDYEGEGPYAERVEFHDIGDDTSAALGVIASKQVHGLMRIDDVLSLDAYKALPHVNLHKVNTAQTGVARMKPIGPFADPRVRKAMRLAVDTNKLLQAAYRGLGTPGEHHHVARCILIMPSSPL